MNVIVIMVYDRRHNIDKWMLALSQCKVDAEVVVIHSGKDKWDLPKFVKYIKVDNIGFDMAKFQDVCLGRLKGFPKDWDNLLWVADDCLPLTKDFDKIFWDKLKPKDVGVACMTISPYVRRHIRTTGFCIKREVAEKITFPADPITTKEESYHFEHRSQNHFLYQVEKLGYKAVQVAPDIESPMLDFGYHRRLRNREKEFYLTFQSHLVSEVKDYSDRDLETGEKKQPLVIFICPVYKNYPQIVSCLICQTYQNWELHLIHDGPGKTDLPDDPRIFYSETKERVGNWGHSIRSEYLQKLDADFVVISNPDNMIVPVFIEYMLAGFRHKAIVATYCSDMVHSYKKWQVIPCSLRRGYLDCSGVMVRMEAAKKVGWNDVTSHSADWQYFADIIKKYGVNSFNKVKGTLLIHN